LGYLLKEGANINEKDNDGGTALHYAASEGHVNSLKHLLDKGANINQKTKEGLTVLHLVALKGHVENLKYLLDKGANINEKANNGRTVLHYIASSGSIENLKYLFEKGANINEKDNHGLTPLHWAALKGHIAVLQYLFEKGANINERDNHGLTPLHWAALKGHIAVLQYLLDKGVNVNEKSNIGQTALHAAAFLDHVEALRCLLDKGADINERNNSGQTVVHYAVSSGHVEALRYLLENGAKINEKEKGGQTALHFAAYLGHVKALRYLLDKGGNINEKDKDGQTALHLSAYFGRLDVLKCLLGEGVNINEKNNDGQTALHVAAYSGHVEVLRYLLDKGANVNEKDSQRNSLIFFAKENFEIIKIICENGFILPINQQRPRTRSKKINNYLARSYILSNPEITKDELEALQFTAAELNIQFEYRMSALSLAIGRDRIDIMVWLITHGASLDEKTPAGKNACDRLQLQQIEKLLRLFADGPEQIIKILIELQFKKLQTQQASKEKINKKFEHFKRKLHKQLLKASVKKAYNLLELKFKIQQRMNILPRHEKFTQQLESLLNRVNVPCQMLDINTERPAFRLFSFKKGRAPYSIDALLFRPVRELLKDIKSFINLYNKNRSYLDICEYLTKLHECLQSNFAPLLNEVNKLRLNENLSDEDYYQRVQKLARNPPTISSIIQYHAYLKKEATAKLTPPEGETDIRIKETETGSHPIVIYGNVHYKFHQETRPCYPAIEFLVASFYNVLADGEYGIAPTEIVSIQGHGYRQIAIASLTVEGITLQKFLNNHAKEHPEYLNNFDPNSFFMVAIMGMILRLGDAKGDNYMVQLVPEGDTFVVRIIGIDNEEAFVEAVIKSHRSREGNTLHYTEIKNIF
ncbi:MAG: ankyrin repeat domain-containing protein, partial [Gammaproteobacteria bacterium]